MAAFGALGAEAPPLPSSFYGTVTIDGQPAPNGTIVSARYSGVEIASAPVESSGAESYYRLHVPGDRTETPAVEGPAEGGIFEIRVSGALAQSSDWQAGTFRPLALAASGGADLSVSLADGTNSISPGASSSFTARVENLGPGSAAATRLVAELPEGCTVLSASHGGAVTGRQVEWWLGEMAEDSSVERTLSYEVTAVFPSGIEELVVLSRVSHDGTEGVDANPVNNEAVDRNELVATPDLAVALTASVGSLRPGETIVYRAELSNHGSQDATGVAGAFSLPPGTTYYSSSHGGQESGGIVTWPALPLRVGETFRRAVTVRVPASIDSGTATLIAMLEAVDDGANGADPVSSDNQTTIATPVEHGVDLVAVAVDLGALVTEPVQAQVSGSVAVEVENAGSISIPLHRVVVFEDLDADGLFQRVSDNVLGEVVISAPGAGESERVDIPVAGIVRFAGAFLHAMVDADTEVVELEESNNVVSGSTSCPRPLATDPFSWVEKTRWPAWDEEIFKPDSTDSLSTPIVVQLTDDNGDGLFDENDVPDIVFVTNNPYAYPLPEIYLRAIQGDTGAKIFDVNGFIPTATGGEAFSFSGLAAGDIDLDGRPELLTTTFGPGGINHLVALEHTGQWKWMSPAYRTHPVPGGLTNRDNPTLADLDGDGSPEILVGANVFDRHGNLRWRGAAGQAFQSSGNAGDRGGAISIAADVDFDGLQEVVTGNTLYGHDGTILWQVALPDGFPAVANFDADVQPEIVVVAQGTVRLHDTDGALLWGPVELPGSDPEAGGPPTIADMDGDGLPEIGVGGTDVYVVFESDGTIRWQASTQDYTSNITGSTAFDFDGDGAMEVVYRDERRLRIYRGTDGEVLYETVASSNTWTEEPVIADIDRDGFAELIVSTDSAPDVSIPGGDRTSGLRIFRGRNSPWRWARPIWNQHAYSIDNVTEAAGIPRLPAAGWLSHNTFRCNSSTSSVDQGLPDLTVSRVVVTVTEPPAVHVSARIGNAGRRVAPAGVEAAIGLPGTAATLFTLPAPLEPGAFHDVEAELPNPFSLGSVVVEVDGPAAHVECNEQNNVLEVPLNLQAMGLSLRLTANTTAVAPGETIVYSFSVRNSFSGTAQGVALTATLPPDTTLVSVGSGGTLSGSTLTWPPFSINSGASTGRVITLRVNSTIPPATPSITTVATVDYNGAHGPDPTPGNNTASLTSPIVSVTAEAGGPYAGFEATPLIFDGSASVEAAGTIVSYEWDVDNNGVYDVSGVNASYTFLFPITGTRTIRLRVTNDAGEVDTDTATVTIASLLPEIGGVPPFGGVEGSTVSTAPIAVSDPGPPEALRGVFQWGDGTSTTVQVPTWQGTVSGSHLYADDAEYPVEVCVRDPQSLQACATTVASITNEAPVILDNADLSFADWQGEEVGGGDTSVWDLQGDPRQVVERLNGRPSFFAGDLPSRGAVAIDLQVQEIWDDDFVGFAFGFDRGDSSNPDADYLLLDWKRATQSGAQRGMAISRVRGVPTHTEFWLHQDQAANGSSNGVTEIARALTLGDRGWSGGRTYAFRFEMGSSRLRVWVDGRLEFDLDGTVPAGGLALYDYSQARAGFTLRPSALQVVDSEGAEVELHARFTDRGRLDTHDAFATWGDGAAGPGTADSESGEGEAVWSHVYIEDGSFASDLCVADDDGGSDCIEVPAEILNRAPLVELVVATSGYFEDPVSIAGSTFVDPGVLDTHTASVDWGDGQVESWTPLESAGAGSLERVHSYGSPGTYALRVCVLDDDGSEGCSSRELLLPGRRLDLAVLQSITLTEARPGSRVTITVEARNAGTLPASGVATALVLPTGLTLFSSTPPATVSGQTLEWDLGDLLPAAAISLTVVADVAPGVAPGTVLTIQSGIADDGAHGDDVDSGNDVAVSSIEIFDAVTPIVSALVVPGGVEGLQIEISGGWSDTTAGESHTGTVDWGDGTTSAAILSPAAGLSGVLGAEHTYVDDGLYAVRVCVRDGASHESCRETQSTIENSPPDVPGEGVVDLRQWTFETSVGEEATSFPSWEVAEDGLSVLQTVNSAPTVFYGPAPITESEISGVLRVEPSGAWDNDFVGFVLGYQPGELGELPGEYLLIDWKQGTQAVGSECGNANALAGLVISRVVGLASGGELWGHYDQECNGTENRVEVLARAATLGNVGWSEGRDYTFRFEYDSSHIKVWVNNVLQFDLVGSFPPGRFGFYGHSQEDARYRGFLQTTATKFEGEEFALHVGFGDLGTEDLHSGIVRWDDGTSNEAEIEESAGSGFAVASHVYDDDGDYRVEVCIADGDGGETCGDWPLIVANVPPEVTASGDLTIPLEGSEGVELATFHDPGVLDSFTATLDLGDGPQPFESVIADAGVGRVVGSLYFDEPGSYPATICVQDDDGGEDCASFSIHVDGALPYLAAVKSAMLLDLDGDGAAGPGDELLYRIEVSNTGSVAATLVRFVDFIPEHTEVVPGSVVPVVLTQSESPVVVEIPLLQPEEQVSIQFAVRIESPLAPGVREIVNSGSLSSLEVSAVATDDPATEWVYGDPTRTPVTAEVEARLAKSAIVADIDGDGDHGPGDEIEWALELAVDGTTSATGVLVRDPIPATTTLLPASIEADGANVVGLDPLALLFDAVAPGSVRTVRFRTAISEALPAEVNSIANQAEVSAEELDTVLSDDPATPAPGDPTVVAIERTPRLSVNDQLATEGMSGLSIATFHLVLDRPAAALSSVAWAIVGVSASPGEDFAAASGVAAVAAGTTEATVEVEIVGDVVVETDETLELRLSEPSGLRLDDDRGVLTILNDDVTTLAINDAGANEGESVRFRISLSAPSALPVVVQLATADQTATSSLDYDPVATTTTFAPLEVERWIDVSTLDDPDPEIDETFWLRALSATIASLGDAEGLGTILDDDPVDLSIDDAMVVEGNEGETELAFRVSLSSPTPRTVGVDLASLAISATEGEDYLGRGERFTIPAGAVEAWFTIAVLGDVLDEPDELLSVVGSNVTGATLIDGAGVGTIVDDDEPSTSCLGPNLLVNGDAETAGDGCSIPDWNREEGRWRVERGSTNPPSHEGAAFFSGRAGGEEDLWELSGGSGGDCGDHDLQLSSGPQIVLLHDEEECEDDDLQAMSGGDDECIAELEQTVYVGAFAPRIDAGAQTFQFRARLRTESEQPATRVRILVEYRATSSGTPLEIFDSGWIWSDSQWSVAEDLRSAPAGTRKIRVRLLVDGGGEAASGYFDALELMPVDTTVLAALSLTEYEGHTGTHDALIPLVVSCPSPSPMSLGFATSDGSARSPHDYLSRSGSLLLPALSTGASVTVPIVGDRVNEPDEKFNVQFTASDLGEAVLFDSRSEVTIRNDDFCRRSPGYWKTHRSSWPVRKLVVGGVEYEESALAGFLDYGGSDGATRLARHLVAAKLNLAKGSDPWILPVVEAADLFLVEHPPGSNPGGTALDEANALKDDLDAYNNTGCGGPQ